MSNSPAAKAPWLKVSKSLKLPNQLIVCLLVRCFVSLADLLILWLDGADHSASPGSVCLWPFHSKRDTEDEEGDGEEQVDSLASI